MVALLFSAFFVGVSIVFGQALPAGEVIYDGVVHYANVDLFVLDIGRGIALNLTRTHELDTQGVWSPDGQHIAFHSRRDGARWIYIMDAWGRNLRPLTTDPKISQYNPVWSPEGKRIFYQAYPGRNAPVYSINIDGSDVQRQDTRTYRDLFLPPFDPARFMVMAYKNGNWGIYMYNSGWTNMRQLTNNNVLFRELPQWSSDDRQVAFVSLDRMESEVYVMNPDGSDFRRITNDGVRKSNLAWRPQS